MNLLFVDPAVEVDVINAARAAERASQYGINAGPLWAKFDAARARQAEVRRVRGERLRASGAISW